MSAKVSAEEGTNGTENGNGVEKMIEEVDGPPKFGKFIYILANQF